MSTLNLRYLQEPQGICGAWVNLHLEFRAELRKGDRKLGTGESSNITIHMH